MRALLLVETDRVADIARFYMRPLGFETIRYRNPVKAIDNLEEIGPDAVVVSARDFPRHWKTIAQAIRAERAKDDCVIILLRGEAFPLEEAAKATHLGVNGVLGENLEDRREQSQFQRLLKRYVPVEDNRAAERISPSPWDRLDFMFAHPVTLAPVAGRLETVAPTGVSFVPDSPALVADLEPGGLIDDCSLRVGDSILSFSCRVIRLDRVIGLSIETISEEDRRRIEEYLASCPERELKALLSRDEKSEDR